MAQKKRELKPHEKIAAIEHLTLAPDDKPGQIGPLEEAIIPALKDLEKDPDPAVKSHAKRIRESLQRRINKK